MSLFTGAGVAIITPMKENGDVNYEKFAEIIEDQIAGGIDAIIVCGTTGEAATLSHEEHLSVIEACVKYVNKRVPVIAGTGSNCTETAIYLSTEAEKLGADGLLVVTPYYNKATQQGLYEHFKMVADSVKIPIILYNIPGRTGCTMTSDTVIRLCKDVPNIVGVKDATANMTEVARLLSKADGGKGVISVLAIVAPKQTHDMCQLYFDGKVEEARKEQLRAIPLIDALFSEVNPIPVKKAMNLMGKEVGPLRRPLTEMEPAHAEVLKKAMEDYGLL